MVYITGDTHGDLNRFTDINMGDTAWTAEDCLIICGDFGFLFGREKEREDAMLDVLAAKPYTICFCDGNHECFPDIFSYPEEEWNGGRVHRIRKNVLHLMRGQIFEIQGSSFFVFGGAYSVDMPAKAAAGRWWKEELPTLQEIEIGKRNLERYNHRVDYIITHTAPQSVLDEWKKSMSWVERANFAPEIFLEEFDLQSFLGEVDFNTTFRHWYFGHWHQDATFGGKYTVTLLEVHPVHKPLPEEIK